MRTITHLAAGLGPLVKIEDQTSHATGGTRTTITNTLRDHVGNLVAPTIVIPVVRAADADGSVTAATVHVVSADADEIVVRASAASVNFDLYLA